MELLYADDLVISHKRQTAGAKKEKDRKSIWNQSANISLKSKVQIYRAAVLSSVLYGAESWTSTDKKYSRLNKFSETVQSIDKKITG
jgi:hypothetical protein